MGKILEDRKLAVIIVAIFIVALTIRLSIIDLRPLHHDEGVDAISFVKPLYEFGEYRYNPKSPYHGPFLYYANALSFHIFGVNEFALRFFGILFSSSLVLLIYPLRKYLGTVGSITAATFLSIATIFVHYSTYSSSHELPFLVFELALITSFFLFYETKDRKYIYSGIISLGLLFTTKETAYAATFLLFLFPVVALLIKTKKTRVNSVKRNMRDVLSFISGYKKDAVKAALIAFFIFAAFYTSFFKYPNNLVPTVTETLPYMLSFSEQYKGHEKPFFYYTELLFNYDLPILLFALVGLYCFRKSLFTKFWVYFLIATWFSFSYVAYKTPWLTLHIMLPLSIVAGVGAQEIYRRFRKYAIPIFIAALIYTAWISYNANYIDHSGQFNQLAYVTTAPDFMNLVNKLYTYDKDTEIKVLSSDYWPLPWYLREYKRAGYYGSIVDEPDADVIIIKKEDKEKLEEKLKDKYENRDYQLRYGVWLNAFYRL